MHNGLVILIKIVSDIAHEKNIYIYSHTYVGVYEF